ncbi:MAG: ABC transporter ATP-binding protein, partial [Chloroflexota bacterium]
GTPSSGKSVLVRTLTGLEPPDGGTIKIRGEDVTADSAGERNIGYVPQSFALFPNKTVFQNIAYPLSLGGMSATNARPTVEHMADLLGIKEFLDRKPDQLSGGQKQRVAIARGLVKETEIYVLDDPLVGLDFKLRERLIEDLKRTQKTLDATFIYVTSDAVETMMLASSIAILHKGEVIEVGQPEALYHNPQRPETMHYVGFPQANFVKGKLFAQDDVTQVETALFKTLVQMGAGKSLPNGLNGKGAQTLVGIRPEYIHFGAAPDANMITNEATVYLREDLGGEEIVYLDTPTTQLVTVLRNDQRALLSAEIGEQTSYWIDPADLFVFENGQQLGRGQKEI